MIRLLLSLVLIAGFIARVHAEADADTEIRALIQAVAESCLLYTSDAADE